MHPPLSPNHEYTNAQTITVYARWKECDPPGTTGRVAESKTHRYDIPITPPIPLQVGLRVRVLALSRVAYHAPSVVFPRYETYDPHVVGKIVSVAGRGEGAVTFELRNECDLNPVKRVRLTVRMLPGITASLSPDELHVNGADGPRGSPMESDVTITELSCDRRCGTDSCKRQWAREWGFMIEYVRVI